MPLERLTHPDDWPLDAAAIGRASSPGQTQLTRHKRYVTKSGDLVWADVAGTIVRDERGEPSFGVAMVKDVTEQRRADDERRNLEEQLRQAQKMEAIGRLAGGVAHDFNNLLTGIQGYADLVALMTKPGEVIHGHADEIRKATRRAAALTQQLLAFSRKRVASPRVVDLNAELDEAERMLGRLIGEDVRLEVVRGADLGRVRIDPHQIDQVLVNLAVNARDAMPEGGALTIETARVELDAGYCASHAGVAPGPYVMIAVSDTGVGMTPDVRGQAFDPFFTTKDKGKGTGLGLSTVYGIVKQNGGSITVYSEVGFGTTFKLYLPLVAGEPAPVEGDERRPPPARGSETVLVVEDEETVRGLAATVLRLAGYQVIEAVDGVEACQLGDAHDGPIALLLTDVVMPRMAGRELFDALTVGRPELRVVYMSGYTESVVSQRGVLTPGTPFLQKPFSGEALMRTVREALDR